jgi:4'-phosphopantetheinyl transferase
MTTLEPNGAHVWIFSTNISSARCEEFRKILSPDEAARTDRIRFIAARGELRLRLASYIDTRPESIVFGVGPHGKPFLRKPASPLQFNLSHSGELAALVVTSGFRCGIDIERVRSKISDQALARRFFSARENAWLQSLPAGQRRHGFFRIWSVKESILKAEGLGISVPLSTVDTSGVLNGTSSLVSTLWVAELNVAEGYTSAVAVENHAPGIRIFPENSPV